MHPTRIFLKILSAEYSRRFLARLGSETGQINIFCGNNPTGSEVCFLAKTNFRLSNGWSNFVKTNCIKKGDKYAFEEDEEGGLLSIRMHLLNGIMLTSNLVLMCLLCF